MKMEILTVVTPPYIYHGCSTWKAFWEGKFTPGEFTPVNMKSCGHHNGRQHRKINNGKNYAPLYISLNDE